MKIGNKDFPLGSHTYVMGILNVTPDSFSDGGKWNTKDMALKHAEQMLAEGADIIDVGGESTRPGFTAISPMEEIERTAAVVEAIRCNFDAVISIDTTKSSVAKECCKVGAGLVNDIWGLKADSGMAKVIAESDVACCLMHNRQDEDYKDLLTDVSSDLRESIKLAIEAGIKRDKIIIDPGIGFAKTYEDNLKLLNNTAALKEIGFPILLGTSRKSVIGYALGVPVEERLAGTLATTVKAVLDGYDFVRVHDVKENVMAIRMTEAILRA